jgi:hypothetical protein
MFLSGYGVCDNFANVFRLLALRLGFECNYVSGQYINQDGTKYGHGWNQIKIDGEWYWVDVDVEGTVYRRGGYSEPLYYLFMKKDSDWVNNHSWLRENWPAVDGTKHPIELLNFDHPEALPQPEPTNTVSAKPTAAKVTVNGVVVAFDAYNIENNNYFKLRDLAYILSGTEKQFDVSWDGAAQSILLLSGLPYTEAGGEMSGKGSGSKDAKPTSSAIIKDGAAVDLTAYHIDGNNYFKLRDIGIAFDFDVSWDQAAQTIVIDTSKPYTPD